MQHHISALDVAAYIVHSFNEANDENDLSQLKLQKLLYYSQGYFAAFTETPLFPEPIEAWENGPVVRDVYVAYKEKYGPGVYLITAPAGGDPSALTDLAAEIVDEVLETRGQFSGWRLRDMTHNEPPWLNHYAEGEKRTIPVDQMAAYFKGFLVPNE